MSNITTKRQEIISTLFRRGDLSYALQSHQKDLHTLLWNSINDKTKRKVAVNCARRFTKTSTSLVVCFEYCIKNKNSSVIFVAPVRSEIKTIIKLIVMSWILKDVTEDVRPEFVESRNEFIFPNGSLLRMAGSNGGNCETIRGNTADLIIVDEAAQIDDLEYVLKSILFPCTLTTRGLTVCLSTPGKMPDNYFHTFCDDCKEISTYFERTIYDNTSLSQEDIDEIADMCGGVDSDDFQREFLCKIIRDQTLTIISEYTAGIAGDIDRHPHYNFFFKFVSMDFGTVDKTAILFASLDFYKNVLYVESEISIDGTDVTVENIAKLAKEKEIELVWKDCPNIIRTGDNSDLIVLHSLSTNYNYPISAVSKTSLHEMVAELRTAIKNGKIIISPDCTDTHMDLDIGQWDKDKKAFKRTVRGHYDHLAALVYLWRIAKIYMNSNPIPAGVDVGFSTNLYKRVDADELMQHQEWKKALKRK